MVFLPPLILDDSLGHFDSASASEMGGESVLRESAPDPMPPTPEASQARIATRIIPKQWGGTETDCPDCKFCDDCDWT